MATATDTRHHRFEIDGYAFHLMFAEWPVRPDHKTRIFIAGQAPVTEMEQPESFEDEPEINRQWRRYNKLEIAKQREVLEAGMALIADQLYAQPDKISFSRTAGCSCGCSPGLVADRALRNKLGQQIENLWITKKAPVQPERTFTMADFDTQEA